MTFASHAYGYHQCVSNSTILFSDLLVWRVREGSADNWAQAISSPDTSQTANLFDAPFNWNTGFRIGIGYNNTLDHWDTLFYWTHYQTKANNNASGQIYSAFLGNFFANNTDGANFGPFYQSANLLWRFAYDTLDLELGRAFKIDRFLNIRPFIGIKTALINQTINTSWYGPSTKVLGVIVPINTFSSATEILKNNFWGIGPSIGLNTTWPIYEKTQDSFDIFGNFSAALLWGHWSFKDDYQNDTPVSISVSVNDVNGAAPMFTAFVGVEWNHYFRQSNLNVRLGYETQVWFDQMQYYSYNMGRLNNLMSLQGSTLEFSYQF